MQKIVLKVDVNDDYHKQKVLKMVSSIYGVDSIAMDMKEKKLTVLGYMDPVVVVTKLRKNYYADILSVGYEKEVKKKKDEPKKPTAVRVTDYVNYPIQPYNNSYAYPHYYNYPANYNAQDRSQENPNACVIC